MKSIEKSIQERLKEYSEENGFGNVLYDVSYESPFLIMLVGRKARDYDHFKASSNNPADMKNIGEYLRAYYDFISLGVLPEKFFILESKRN